MEALRAENPFRPTAGGEQDVSAANTDSPPSISTVNCAPLPPAVSLTTPLLTTVIEPSIEPLIKSPAPVTDEEPLPPPPVDNNNNNSNAPQLALTIDTPGPRTPQASPTTDTPTSMAAVDALSPLSAMKRNKFAPYDDQTRDRLRRSGRDRRQVSSFSPMASPRDAEGSSAFFNGGNSSSSSSSSSSGSRHKRKASEMMSSSDNGSPMSMGYGLSIFNCIVCSKKFDNLRGLRAHFGHKRDDPFHSKVMDQALLDAATVEESLAVNLSPIPTTMRQTRGATRKSERSTPSSASSSLENTSSKSSKSPKIKSPVPASPRESKKRYKSSSSKSAAASSPRIGGIPDSHRHNTNFMDIYCQQGNEALVTYLRQEKEWLTERLKFVTIQLKEQEKIDYCRSELEYLLQAYKSKPSNNYQ
jgi:hypothetical protein